MMSAYLSERDAGRRIMRRCDEMAGASLPGPGVTRLYLSKEHKTAIDLVSLWMREAGMDVHVDGAANVIGRYHGSDGAGPYLLLGSHIDSVIEAGKYDGPLGVITAIDVVAKLNAERRRFAFGIEILAFGDEEGTRFRTTLVGSSAVAGSFDPHALKSEDNSGISLAEAMRAFDLDPTLVGSAARQPRDILAYVEVHIEQGPVLEHENLPIGIVTGISGQTRKLVTFRGEPNHAGTVPMGLRHDPFLAVSELALAAEGVASSLPDSVATVGQVTVRPGAVNVIPGIATMSLDMRAFADEVRQTLVKRIDEKASRIASSRGVALETSTLLDLPACPCAPWLIDQIATSITSICGDRTLRLPSGAGHDGMAMSRLTDIAMIFVRCRGGVSHSPEESVQARDVAIVAEALCRFVETFKPKG
jgi:allantoate deiminase